MDAGHVAAYRPNDDLRIAVLVMPMVDAIAAGIGFTRDPVSSARTVIVEAVRGVADRLAAGEVPGEGVKARCRGAAWPVLHPGS